MTLWFLVALVIAWARRILGYAQVDENDLPDAAIHNMWKQGTPVTIATTPYGFGVVTTTSAALNNASITWTTPL